jgi:NTP pyrophosphatase (non-canonical NTP hydrolase)
VELSELQAIIRATYGDRDRARGLARTHAWFVEECGELSRALFREGPERQAEEFADVLAWLVTLADLAGVDLATAAERYADGCPKCDGSPCQC